jgi:hypothetical protein
VEEKTKLAKKLVEEKLGTTSAFASTAADKATDLAGNAKQWLEGATGLGGLTKVSLHLLLSLASRATETDKFVFPIHRSLTR